MKKETTSGTFFRRCPECRTIGGFCLSRKTVEKDEKYYCEECQKETKLSKWIKSTERNYLRSERNSAVAKRLGK